MSVSGSADEGSSGVEPLGEPGFPLPGDRIAGYELVRQIGAGGMGLVYEAVDTSLGRRVALKLVSPQLAGDPAFRSRFTHEARAQASLDSPYVVPVLAHGEAAGRLFLASRLIPDGDLGARLRSVGPLPPRTALDVVAQVAAGLADAHGAGLVHRDVKPGNVLLRVRGEEVAAYLTDFGLARRSDIDHGSTAHGAPVGTPAYLAPELHTGAEPGPRTDVYSLGCLLWAALVGRAPYVAATDYHLAAAHLSAPVPQLAAAGAWEREVNGILRTAMAKHPDDRYPSAAAMRDDMCRVARERPPACVRPVPPRAPRGRRGRRGVVAAVGAALLGAGVALTSAVSSLDHPPGGPGREAARGPRPEERAAAANISRALRAEGDLRPTEADCAARALLAARSVDELVELGVIDEELELVDDADTGVDAAVLEEIFSLAFSCVFGDRADADTAHRPAARQSRGGVLRPSSQSSKNPVSSSPVVRSIHDQYS